MGITHEVIENTGNLKELESALKVKKADLFFSESPTNPFLRCVDIPKAADVKKFPFCYVDADDL
jgi:cystathionine gamma-synthase